MGVLCTEGMANGTAKGSEPRKPKTPLAELKIDAQTMNMKTVIKCANAKDRAKSNAAQLAKVNLSSLFALASQSIFAATKLSCTLGAVNTTCAAAR